MSNMLNYKKMNNNKNQMNLMFQLYKKTWMKYHKYLWKKYN